MSFWDGLFIGWGIGLILVAIWFYLKWRRSPVDPYEKEYEE